MYSPQFHRRITICIIDWTGGTDLGWFIRVLNRRHWSLTLLSFRLRVTRVWPDSSLMRTGKVGRIFSSTICGVTGSSEAVLVHGRMVYGLIVTAMLVITSRLVWMVAS